MQPGITLRDVIALACRHRGKLALALIVPPLIAMALLFVLPRAYRAQSDILVKTGREYLAADGDAGFTAPTSTKQEGINSEIALLTSRPVVEATIRSIGLETLYPALMEHPPLFATAQDSAVDRFRRDLTVEPVKLSNVIAASFVASSAAMARTVLDRLIQVYIAKHTEVFAGSRAEGYEDSIKTTLAEMERLERQRTRIKIENGIFDIAAQRSALITQRVQAQSRLQDATSAQATLRVRLATLADQMQRIAPVMQTTSTETSREAMHSREALLDLRQAEAALSAQYAEGNQALQRVRAQLAALQRGLAETGNLHANTTTAPSPLYQQVQQELVMGSAQLAPLDGEITRYQTLLSTLGDELQRLEGADLALRVTTSRIDTLSDNIRAIQGRYEQARTQEQTELAKQVSVVQVAKAIAPDRPAKPKKTLLVAGGFLAGLLLAGGVVVLSMFLDKTIITEDAAERLIGLPVLVSLPLLNRRTGPATPDIA